MIIAVIKDALGHRLRVKAIPGFVPPAQCSTMKGRPGVSFSAATCSARARAAAVGKYSSAGDAG